MTYAGQQLATRQRTYSVLSDIKTGQRFATMVTHPGDTADGQPGVHWESFHTVCHSIQHVSVQEVCHGENDYVMNRAQELCHAGDPSKRHSRRSPRRPLGILSHGAPLQ